MEHYKDYFKSRKEVEEYFGKEKFRFSFMSDNIIHFNSLEPVFIDDELVTFQLSFYYELGEDFFDYASFETWLVNFELSQVRMISEVDNQEVQMFFAKYKNI